MKAPPSTGGPSLPGPTRGMRWVMAGEIGRVRQRVRASGEIFWFVDCRPYGRVWSVPDPGSSFPIPIRDKRTAERVLEAIRKSYADHGSLSRALAPWLTKPSAELLVENKLATWLEVWRELVAQAKRSPTSIRELERYAQTDGHFSFWYGRTTLEITTPHVDDFALWLGKRGLSAKTQKNVIGCFRSFVSWLARRGELDGRPEVHWPAIQVAEHVPRVLTLDQQDLVLEAIQWERRGAFLAAATESLRLSEVRAFDLEHYLGSGRLLLTGSIQGPRLNAPRGHTKNKTASIRELWHPELLRWIEWRMDQATLESRVAGVVALFWNPSARNPARRWVPDPMEREWHRACERAGVGRIGFQEGTRHTTLSALGQVLPERVLRAYSRHRDARSLDHYSRPKATPDAIVRALRRRKP